MRRTGLKSDSSPATLPPDQKAPCGQAPARACPGCRRGLRRWCCFLLSDEASSSLAAITSWTAATPPCERGAT